MYSEESESENESGSEEEDEESDEEAVRADEVRKSAEAKNVNPNYKPRPKQEDYQIEKASNYKGLLVCNEVSDNRRGRLRRVMESYLPDLLSGRKIQITAQVLQ